MLHGMPEANRVKHFPRLQEIDDIRLLVNSNSHSFTQEFATCGVKFKCRYIKSSPFGRKGEGAKGRADLQEFSSAAESLDQLQLVYFGFKGTCEVANGSWNGVITGWIVLTEIARDRIQQYNIAIRALAVRKNLVTDPLVQILDQKKKFRSSGALGAGNGRYFRVHGNTLALCAISSVV